ncbi:MAG: hypothetical protein WC208_15180 [Gallionella sp.]|jgi:hypothetical protein
MSHHVSHPQNIIIRQDEGESGWSFKHTYDWTDYHGSLSPENETGFLGHLLSSKPQLFDMAIANTDYKLTMVGEDVMMVVELKSVFETVTIRLKRDEKTENEETRRLNGRVGELEKELGVLTEKMKVESEEMKSEIVSLKWELRELRLGCEKVGECYVPTPTVKDEELARYAMAFHPPIATFVKQQSNTTEVEAFVRWKNADWSRSTCDMFKSWMELYPRKVLSLTSEYLARVRGLSVNVLTVNEKEYTKYPYGSWSILSYENVLYTNGCYHVSPIEYSDINKGMRLLGPYPYTYSDRHNAAYPGTFSISKLPLSHHSLQLRS